MEASDAACAEQPILLTPGPLTTRPQTRRAMLRDWGSRDPSFLALTGEMCRRLLAVAKAPESCAVVPLQGSGTFIVEAVVGTLVPPNGKLLVLINGAYGERMKQIAQRLDRRVSAVCWPEDQPVACDRLAWSLANDPAITHVGVVHCETTTGLLNPLPEIAALVAEHGKALLVDAMSSFGALPIDLGRDPVAALMASSNKCLEGVPGLAFALIDRGILRASRGYARSLALDLHDQWQGFESTGQWRFTPPVQVVAALVEALRLLDAEGGPEARLRRYQANFDCLAKGMGALGFELFLDSAVQAPIIATFRQPRGGWFDFPAFYQALAQRGFLIYPGKLSRAETFRIGCIGSVTPDDYVRLLAAVVATRDKMIHAA